MIKRAFLAAVLAASALLVGCSGFGVSEAEDGRLKVIATIFPAYDLARQVFGDTAEVTLLLKPGTESHSYDPSARDIVKIDSCDLFIYNGGESDAWVENILKSADGVNALRMMDAVEALAEERSEGMTADNDDEEYDEHIWTSPKNAALIVESVMNAAVKTAPGNRSLYESRAWDYIERINELDKRFGELLAGEERYFVFGDRFPLLYFFKEYGLNYYAAFPGCGSETEPSAQTIAFLTEKLSGSGTVPAVFCIELSNRRLAETLANENGLPVAEFHACHNITADDFAAGESYISLMERNYQMLKNAMTNGG